MREVLHSITEKYVWSRKQAIQEDINKILNTIEIKLLALINLLIRNICVIFSLIGLFDYCLYK